MRTLHLLPLLLVVAGASSAVVSAGQIKTPWGGTAAIRGPLTDLDGYADPEDGGALFYTGVPTDDCRKFVQTMLADPNTRFVRVNGKPGDPLARCDRPGLGIDGGNSILIGMTMGQ